MGTDLNPMAVMITKAAVEIPAKFADMPVNPEAKRASEQTGEVQKVLQKTCDILEI